MKKGNNAMTTAAQFDQQTLERLARIRGNPNPRSFVGRVRFVINFFRSLERQRAFEAFRTTFGIIGAAGFAGYIASMHFVCATITLILISATWFGVYTMMETEK
jgi:hypothetical protein